MTSRPTSRRRTATARRRWGRRATPRETEHFRLPISVADRTKVHGLQIGNGRSEIGNPMPLLGIDVGSSSVKTAVLRDGDVWGKTTRAFFPTRHDGVRVEVEPGAILKAVRDSIRELGAAARRAEAITLAVMSPAWVAMDASGKALTPVVTHQDRRSVETAKQLEQRVGKERHL